MSAYALARTAKQSLLIVFIACLGSARSSAQVPPPPADLSMQVAALGFQVVVGETVFYNPLVRNLGPGPADNVVYEIETPQGTTFESVSGGAGFAQTTCSTPPVGDTGTIRCTRPQLPSGSVISMGLRLRISESLAGTFFDTVARVSSSTPDPQPANNSGSSTVLALRVSAESDLSIAVSSIPNPVLPGQTLTHEITVTNHGPDPTTNVNVFLHGLHHNTSLDVDVPAGWACHYIPVGIPPPDFEFMACTTHFFDTGTVTLRIRSDIASTARSPEFLGLRMTSGAVDPVAANNSTSVTTPLGIGSGVPVPTLAPALLSLLALLLASIGVRATLRRN